MYRLVHVLLPVLFCATNAWAWNAEITHRTMSEKAAENSVLSPSKGDYLKNNLGFPNNLDEYFILNGDSQKVRNWIRFGSLEEDAGNPLNGRFYNHFHNPLYTGSQWDQAGLSSSWPWVQSGKSSVLWAIQDTGNDWRWQKVRDYYYKALTAPTETERSANFAQTFRGLGQLIHLVQDAAQPSHVRNDPHPADDKGYVPGFEFWAKDPINRPTVNALMTTAIYPTVALNTSFGGYLPVSRFFDTDQYNGSNPPTGTAVGLAEYTNANFVSEDTILTENNLNDQNPLNDKQYFPYPRRADMEYFEEFKGTWGPFQVYRKYLKKSGGGEEVQHFAYTGRLYKYLSGWPELQTTTLGLDDNVYRDYAEKLIPRAIGYSAGLLNYFFRGRIDMTPAPSNAGQFIIKNESGEDMAGTFALYYDDTAGYRNPVQGAIWTLSVNANGQSDPVTFSAPTSPEPKEKGKYILVFEGRSGNEARAVAGRVLNIETKKELILYMVDGTFKTYNPETREVKIYNGVVPGNGTGQLIWNKDYSYALALNLDGGNRYVNNYIAEIKTGQRYSAGYNTRGVAAYSGAWSGTDKAVVVGPHYPFYGWYYYFSPSKLGLYEFDNGSTNFSVVDYVPIDASNFSQVSVALNGKKAAYLSEKGIFPLQGDISGEFYLSGFDITTKSSSVSVVGHRTFQREQEGTDCNSLRKIINQPVLLAFDNDANLRIMFKNGTETHPCSFGDDGWKTEWRVEHVYDKIGEESRIERHEGGYAGGRTTSSGLGSYLRPLSYHVMKNGEDLIAFVRVEEAYTFNQLYYETPYNVQFDTTLFYKVYLNGSVYDIDAITHSTGLYRPSWDHKAIVNFNAGRDKAVIKMEAGIWDSGVENRHYTARVVYIADSALNNITNDNPDFQRATFFAFVED